MAEMKELLRNIDFFEGLEDKILRKIADTAIRRQYAAGETVVRQGETGLGLYVIVRGRVKVHKLENGVNIQLAELGAQKFFAEMAIVDNKPRSASITTLEDTECLLLTRDSFVALMKKYPEIPIRVARLLADRLRDTSEKLAVASERLGGVAAPVVAPAAPAAGAGATPSAPGPVLVAANGTPAAAPQQAPAASSNNNSGGTKTQIEQALVRSFQSLYTLKAITRFSVAVIGCPVEPVVPECVEQIRIGHVKGLLIPVDQAVTVDIAAYDQGTVNVHVLTPGAEGALYFGPIPVSRDDRLELRVADGDVTMARAGQALPASSRV